MGYRRSFTNKLSRGLTVLSNKVGKYVETTGTYPQDRDKSLIKAKMQHFLNFSTKDPLQTTSEAGWINRKNLILTLNNEYYLINLKHSDLNKVKNSIQYGKQMVNMSLFCSIVTKDFKDKIRS